MTKIAKRYLEVHPWIIREEGFHPDRSEVSESIFSVANEYMGIRGYFDEGFSGPSITGCYLNALYETFDVQYAKHYAGHTKIYQEMANTVNWLQMHISIDGEKLDLATSQHSGFFREIDMRNALLKREFVWRTHSGKHLKLCFERFVSMANPQHGFQRITFEALNFSGTVDLLMGLDAASLVNPDGLNVWDERAKNSANHSSLLIQTRKSKQLVYAAFRIHADTAINQSVVESDKNIATKFSLALQQNKKTKLTKNVFFNSEKKIVGESADFFAKCEKIAITQLDTDFDVEFAKHCAVWDTLWKTSDIVIDGDSLNQQGVRFCIFSLHQTFHGLNPELNVPARGLTSQYYGGTSWWDTETYCLPFYLFNNPEAARNLLKYRYKLLPAAIARAAEVEDGVGARYPMQTIDGPECCYVWQAGDLEIHVSGAVAYGIWHYTKTTGDKSFLYQQGIEMLIEISRYYAYRGKFNQLTGKFGYWNVMGPDEFHMQVHNNAYINNLAKYMMEYTLDVIAEMKINAPQQLTAAFQKTNFKDSETADWKNKIELTETKYDDKTGMLEQFDLFYQFPHIDIKSIKPEEYPLYDHWAYLRIFWYDMVKQPDVLMLQFLFGQKFSLQSKKANYEYYEPRTAHESSLSPAIHSIIAAEIGKRDDAYNYFLHATRLDLDDYNNNTNGGLHTTSMAAAWMNIVYGFGGMKSDGDVLHFTPMMPENWESLSFKIQYMGNILSIKLTKNTATFQLENAGRLDIKVFENKYIIGTAITEIKF